MLSKGFLSIAASFGSLLVTFLELSLGINGNYLHVILKPYMTTLLLHECFPEIHFWSHPIVHVLLTLAVKIRFISFIQ